MPKVYTYNAEFNPISFTDRIAPMKIYKEEYDKQQAAYEKMLEETDDLGVLKDIAMDSDSYGVYKSFQDELTSIADEMSTNGLSNDIRNRLLQLKRRQASEINPLLEKQKTRAGLVAEQRKYLQTHPNAIFDIDYDSTPLSKINDGSTYRPYDLEKGYTSIAETIYSNMMSNNGNDTTDYNEIKSQYNYDKLSPLKRKQIDDIIGLARNKAAATYRIYKDKEAMDMYRYNRTGTRTGTRIGSTQQNNYSSYRDILNSTKKGSYVANVNGDAVQISVSANGQKTVKDYKGKAKVIDVPQRNDGESDNDYEVRLQKSVAKAYYGHNLEGTITTNAGENIVVLKGDDNKYYIIDSKKNIKPVRNINDKRELLTAYRDKVINYGNNISASYNNDNNVYEIKDTDVVDDSNPVKTYETLADTTGDLGLSVFLANLNISDEDLPSLFNDGFGIYKYNIKDKRGRIVGSQYVIKEPEKIEQLAMRNTAPTPRPTPNDDLLE